MTDQTWSSQPSKVPHGIVPKTLKVKAGKVQMLSLLHCSSTDLDQGRCSLFPLGSPQPPPTLTRLGPMRKVDGEVSGEQLHQATEEGEHHHVFEQDHKSLLPIPQPWSISAVCGRWAGTHLHAPLNQGHTSDALTPSTTLQHFGSFFSSPRDEARQLQSRREATAEPSHRREDQSQSETGDDTPLIATKKKNHMARGIQNIAF